MAFCSHEGVCPASVSGLLLACWNCVLCLMCALADWADYRQEVFDEADQPWQAIDCFTECRLPALYNCFGW